MAGEAHDWDATQRSGHFAMVIMGLHLSMTRLAGMETVHIGRDRRRRGSRYMATWSGLDRRPCN